jgi:hypothetical protein
LQARAGARREADRQRLLALRMQAGEGRWG